MINLIKKINAVHPLLIPFILSFVFWCIAFRGFLSNQLALSSDAMAYVQHFKFYIDNIIRGVYPSWDPERQWGVPVEFFLRRIGSFNPFILVLALLVKIGIPYTLAYQFFLAGYYFLGLIGFYLLAKQIFQDRQQAFLAFVLLLFSSLGTRLFDSYIILTFVPMVWFFYFLVAFAREPREHYWVGLTLTLMIIFTTYIPFYFLTIVFSFLICFAVIYFSSLKEIVSRAVNFLKQKKWLALFCLFAVVVAFVPGILFFMEGQKGEIVFPVRHVESPLKDFVSGNAQNVVMVKKDNITEWGIIEDLLFSNYFLQDLKKFRFAVFYVPLFAYILLCQGIVTFINRRVLLLLIWGLGIFAMGSPYANQFYNFFYNHVFYFKYFRNLHFYLWLILLPIFILFIVEQYRQFLAIQIDNHKKRNLLLVFVGIVHLGLIYFLYQKGFRAVSSYSVLVLSFLFWLSWLRGWIKITSVSIPVFLFLLVCLEPMEAYSYLARNSMKYARPYVYQPFAPNVSLPSQQDKEAILKQQKIFQAQDLSEIEERRNLGIYMSTYWLNFLREHLHLQIFNLYGSLKFIVYDQVQRVKDDKINFDQLEQDFIHMRNSAYVPFDYNEGQEESAAILSGNQGLLGIGKRSLSDNLPPAEIITQDSSELEIVNFDVNTIKIKTRFSARKFLVYNDSFHSGWEAFIDGQKVKIWRANIAFKGLWIPAGEHVIFMHYGTAQRTVLNIFFIGFFNVVLATFFLYFQRNFEQRTLNLVQSRGPVQ